MRIGVHAVFARPEFCTEDADFIAQIRETHDRLYHPRLPSRFVLVYPIETSLAFLRDEVRSRVGEAMKIDVALGHFSEFTFVGDAGSASFDSLTGQLDVVAYNRRADLQSERGCTLDVRASFGEPAYDLVAQNGDFLSRVASGAGLRFPASDTLRSMIWPGIAEASLRQSGARLTFDASASFTCHGTAQG